jgi:hypothetical protein
MFGFTDEEIAAYISHVKIDIVLSLAGIAFAGLLYCLLFRKIP